QGQDPSVRRRARREGARAARAYRSHAHQRAARLRHAGCRRRRDARARDRRRSDRRAVRRSQSRQAAPLVVTSTKRGAQAGLMVAIDTSSAAAIASVMMSRTWATIDELLGAVLDRTVTRAELREFVIAQWNAKRFAFRA